MILSILVAIFNAYQCYNYYGVCIIPSSFTAIQYCSCIIIKLKSREPGDEAIVDSIAYLRHVGPTSLQYGTPFNVGIGKIHKL